MQRLKLPILTMRLIPREWKSFRGNSGKGYGGRYRIRTHVSGLEGQSDIQATLIALGRVVCVNLMISEQ